MHLRAQLRRMMIPTMLCAFVAAVTLSPAALAQSRGDSGLPSGPGNPVAQFQQQIDALTEQMTTLARQLAELETSQALGVYDANDNRIGDVIGVQDTIPWVSVKTAGRVVALQVFPGRLVGGFLWYTGRGCTGQVYIGPVGSREPNVFSVAAVQEDGVVYAAEAGAEAQGVMVRSLFPTTLFPYNGTCLTLPTLQNRNVLPATPLMTLDDGPYSVH